MVRKNVTVAIDAETLKEARHIAVEKGMSLSALLGITLEILVRDDVSYRRARNRQAALLKNPPDLGTKGKATWTRKDLHDR